MKKWTSRPPTSWVPMQDAFHPTIVIKVANFYTADVIRHDIVHDNCFDMPSKQSKNKTKTTKQHNTKHNHKQRHYPAKMVMIKVKLVREITSTKWFLTNSFRNNKALHHVSARTYYPLAIPLCCNRSVLRSHGLEQCARLHHVRFAGYCC